MSFLDRLTLSDSERRVLAALGATTPFALAGAIRAARDPFRRAIGDPARADAIEREVLNMLSPDERAALDGPVPKFPLGARRPDPDK